MPPSPIRESPNAARRVTPSAAYFFMPEKRLHAMSKGYSDETSEVRIARATHTEKANFPRMTYKKGISAWSAASPPP